MTADAIKRLVSWFTPVAQGSGESGSHEQQLLTSFCLITIPFSLLYVTVSYVIGFHVGVWLMLACFVLLLAILFAFRNSGRFRLCANLYLANCFFIAILGCSYFSGGIHSMVTPWFVLVPVASVLVLEQRRDTITWTLLTCAAIEAYGTAEMRGFDFPALYDSRFKDFFDTICIAGLAIILSWIAFMFDRNRSQAMATITGQKVSLQNALAEIEQLAYYDTRRGCRIGACSWTGSIRHLRTTKGTAAMPR